ncbi:uncharacterized protein V1510DRAFT_415641 [Dipodascopsis tothii]|uniref:uncharacterized protein n=1 Tax=Dipodascopsis tothii TaxID=44089 RepID=UPI0034CF61D3
MNYAGRPQLFRTPSEILLRSFNPNTPSRRTSLPLHRSDDVADESESQYWDVDVSTQHRKREDVPFARALQGLPTLLTTIVEQSLTKPPFEGTKRTDEPANMNALAPILEWKPVRAALAVPGAVLGYVDARLDVPTLFEPAFVQSSHFQAYYSSGGVSSTSRKIIVALSLVFMGALISFVEIQSVANINPLMLVLTTTLCGFAALRLLIPRGLTLTGSALSALETTAPGKGRVVMAGATSEIALVFRDRRRLARAVAMGIVQFVFVLLFGYVGITQSMASIHMNFFSVLPAADFVLQRIVFKINMIFCRRVAAGAVFNLVPQVFALLARNWEISAVGFPVAVLFVVWIFFAHIEQAYVDGGEWLSTVFVSYMAMSIVIGPVGFVCVCIFELYGGVKGDTLGLDGLAMPNLIAALIAGGCLFTLFLSAGYLTKVSSSAHIFALVSTCSLLLILSEGLVSLFFATVGLLAVIIAWIVYVG